MSQRFPATSPLDSFSLRGLYSPMANHDGLGRRALKASGLHN